MRRKLGPPANLWGTLAVALVASLGWSSIESVAAPSLKTQTAPTPPPRPLEPLEQQQTVPATARGAEGRETTHAPAPKAPAAPEARAMKQSAPAGKNPSATQQAGEPTFPSLPAASRARMRDCGHEWQEMKRTGEARELTWRDFATQCLTR